MPPPHGPGRPPRTRALQRDQASEDDQPYSVDFTCATAGPLMRAPVICQQLPADTCYELSLASTSPQGSPVASIRGVRAPDGSFGPTGLPAAAGGVSAPYGPANGGGGEAGLASLRDSPFGAGAAAQQQWSVLSFDWPAGHAPGPCCHAATCATCHRYTAALEQHRNVRRPPYCAH